MHAGLSANRTQGKKRLTAAYDFGPAFFPSEKIDPDPEVFAPILKEWAMAQGADCFAYWVDPWEGDFQSTVHRLEDFDAKRLARERLWNEVDQLFWDKAFYPFIWDKVL